MTGFESVVEEAAIEYLVELGYDYIHGPDIAPDGTSPERSTYGDVVLAERLKAAELDGEFDEALRGLGYEV